MLKILYYFSYLGLSPQLAPRAGSAPVARAPPLDPSLLDGEDGPKLNCPQSSRAAAQAYHLWPILSKGTCSQGGCQIVGLPSHGAGQRHVSISVMASREGATLERASSGTLVRKTVSYLAGLPALSKRSDRRKLVARGPSPVLLSELRGPFLGDSVANRATMLKLINRRLSTGSLRATLK